MWYNLMIQMYEASNPMLSLRIQADGRLKIQLLWTPIKMGIKTFRQSNFPLGLDGHVEIMGWHV